MLVICVTAMVNFMCQFDWATGWPWYLVQHCFWAHRRVRVTLDEISIWIGRLSIADYPPSGGWASSNMMPLWVAQKGGVRGNFSLNSEPRRWSLPAFWLAWKNCSFQVWSLLAFGLDLTPLALLGVQFAHCRSRDFLDSIIVRANSL